MQVQIFGINFYFISGAVLLRFSKRAGDGTIIRPQRTTGILQSTNLSLSTPVFLYGQQYWEIHVITMISVVINLFNLSVSFPRFMLVVTYHLELTLSLLVHVHSTYPHLLFLPSLLCP